MDYHIEHFYKIATYVCENYLLSAYTGLVGT